MASTKPNTEVDVDAKQTSQNLFRGGGAPEVFLILSSFFLTLITRRRSGKSQASAGDNDKYILSVSSAPESSMMLSVRPPPGRSLSTHLTWFLATTSGEV